MKQDTVFLKRFCNDGRITQDQFYVKNFREFSVIMQYVRSTVSSGLAHFEVKFVCCSQNFTLLGAL